MIIFHQIFYKHISLHFTYTMRKNQPYDQPFGQRISIHKHVWKEVEQKSDVLRRALEECPKENLKDVKKVVSGIKVIPFDL